MTPDARTGRLDEPAPDTFLDRALDWDQMGVPVAVLGTDGALLSSNRGFKLLISSARQQAAMTGLDWLACLTTESRIALFTALADRRPVVGALAWQGSANRGRRWFAATLRWRADQGHCLMTWQDVTLLRQAERLATSRAEQLRLLANAAPVMMAYFEADSMRCLFANLPYAQSFGRDETTVVGLTLTEIVGEERAQLIDPAVDQVRRTLRATEFEHEVVAPDKLARRVEVQLVPHFDAASGLDGVFFYMTDVTRQRDGERALRQSEERLSRFMQGSAEGIVFHDAGVIVDANPAFCDLLGYALHDLIGRALDEFVDADAGAPADPVPSGLPESTRPERLLRHCDGSLIPVQWLAMALDGAPDPAIPALAGSGGLLMTAVRDIRDDKAAQARAHYLAHHDPLTGLPNRHAFLAQLEHMMVAARASNTTLGLLFIDLDHFKRVNDSVGHAAADTHLSTIAQRIAEHVRSTDRVARFGGDEFMVLLPGVRENDDVSSVANKLINALAQPIDIEGRPISVTPSIGVALYPRDATSPDELIKHADTAMHVAKARGRATFTVFDRSIAELAYDNVVLEGQLGHAIAQDEFTLLFQPQVCARTGQPTGAEALIRWRHPERGLLAPDEFIALAEQHRLMLPIGRWVLEEAAATAQRWQARGLTGLTMAVNLSALQFQAADFIDGIEDLLARTALAPGWLELEITERMLMDDLPTVRDRLHRLRARGVRISIDDFGTGFSSLAHLKDLPIDKMKIDRSFVRDLPGDRASTAIAGAIIQLARGLGLTVLAEGVESAAQQQCLVGLRCDQLQGRAVSVPLSAEAFEQWLAGWPAQARIQWAPSDVALWSAAL